MSISIGLFSGIGASLIWTSATDAYLATAAQKWDAFADPINVGFHAAPHKCLLLQVVWLTVPVYCKKSWEVLTETLALSSEAIRLLLEECTWDNK